MIEDAKRLETQTEEQDRQLLKDYGNGLVGREVFEAIKGLRSGEPEWDKLIKQAEEGWIETERGAEPLSKNPDPRQDHPRQDSGLRWSGEVVSFPVKKDEKPTSDVLDLPPTKFTKSEGAWLEAPLAPANATGFEALTYPRGLLGHVTQHVYDTAKLPSRPIALATALSGLSKMLDGKVLGPEDCKTSLYIWLVAENGAGKQHGINNLHLLLRTVSLEALIVAGGLASLQALEEVMVGADYSTTKSFDAAPNALFPIDEIGSWLTRISTGQGGNVSEIPGLLCTLWSWPLDVPWSNTKKKGDNARSTRHVSLGIFGASTKASLIAALKTKHVSGGFISRNLYLDAGRGADIPVNPKYHWQSIPTWLANALKDVVKALPSMALIGLKHQEN